MSDLPSGWRYRTLAEVSSVTMGQSPPGASYNSIGDGAPFFQGKAEFGDLFASVRKWTTAGTKFARAGDILLSVRAPVGPTNLAPVDCAIGRGLAGIRATVEVEQRFLLWALREREPVLAGLGQGSTFAAVSGAQLRALHVPVPPLDEQRRIVDLLEDHLSRLDAAAGGLKAARRRLNGLRRSALRAIAIGPTLTLGELALESGYGTSTKCTEEGAGVPVVRIPNLVDGRIDLSDQKRASDPNVDLRALMLEPGDLLVVRTNGSRDLIGRAAVVQPGLSAAFASYLIRFQVDQDRVRPEWVRLMLEAPTTRSVLEGLAASSAGQYNLGLAKLNGVALPCPKLNIQDALLAKAEVLAQSRTRLMTELRHAELRRESLKRSLMGAAFSGRLSRRASDLECKQEAVLG